MRRRRWWWNPRILHHPLPQEGSTPATKLKLKMRVMPGGSLSWHSPVVVKTQIWRRRRTAWGKERDWEENTVLQQQPRNSRGCQHLSFGNSPPPDSPQSQQASPSGSWFLWHLPMQWMQQAPVQSNPSDISNKSNTYSNRDICSFQVWGLQIWNQGPGSL